MHNGYINILTSHITNFIEATYITVYSSFSEISVLTGSTGANFWRQLGIPGLFYYDAVFTAGGGTSPLSAWSKHYPREGENSPGRGACWGLENGRRGGGPKRTISGCRVLKGYSAVGESHKGTVTVRRIPVGSYDLGLSPSFTYAPSDDLSFHERIFLQIFQTNSSTVRNGLGLRYCQQKWPQIFCSR
jgi:hypothetical protein